MHRRLLFLWALPLLACRGASPRVDRDAGAVGATAVDARAPEAAADLAPNERARLLDEVARRFEAHYVFADAGARAASALRERASRGDFAGVVRVSELASRVTSALRDETHDKHAMLEWTPPEATTAEDIAWERLEAEHRATGGFGATTRHPGGVAQIVIDSFEPEDAALETIARRMGEIADASALIIDLRANHGGDPATVARVASHLFDARVHLNDMWWRDDGSTDTFFTTPVAGRHLGGEKPVFVLTSKDTFSAAEELAYDLQCLHRAVVVGETTRGGAHPVARAVLSPQLTLRIPTGRAINPHTKTNWEGTGVTPDVPVSAADALPAALERAARAIERRPARPRGDRIY